MDENPNEYRNPKRINEPLTLILWPMHHILPPMMMLGLGLVFGNPILLVLIGMIWFYLIRYIEARYPRGYLLHYWWYNGLSAGFLKETRSVPDPFKRKFY